MGKCTWCPASYSTAIELKMHQMRCPYATDHRDDEIARLNLRVAQLTSGSEAANLAGRVVEQDAEIARLKAELADTRAELGRAMLTGREIEHENNRLRRALAAAPAALREIIGEPDTNDRDVYEHACGEVERAQAAALREGK